MKIHILGICGTFMGGVALLARQLGHEVTGCDQAVYPPMSTQLQEQGIKLYPGFGAEQLDYKPDLIIVGNVMKRGMPVVERMLNEDFAYTSGPAWIANYALKDRHTLAVAGTHGKTTTTSMLTWILDYAGLEPGFLMGGVPENFGVSARLGKGKTFVIEADEYDSAFFDKRSKFIHYHPRTLIANNLEFDHADIFDDLAAIQKQFHYLVRTVPNKGLIVAPQSDTPLRTVFEMGIWTPIEFTGTHWKANLLKDDASQTEIFYHDKLIGTLSWDLIGQHNIANALAAIAAAQHVGIEPNKAIEALAHFKNVKRRLEYIATINDITVYDDFAHHPTAIATTLAGLRAKVGESKRIIAIAELGSYTMRSGVHRDSLVPSFKNANEVFIYIPPDAIGHVLADPEDPRITVLTDMDQLLKSVINLIEPFDQILIMSNRGFQGFKEKLLDKLKQRYT
jgi:UDP-N-acetylmuramate: L-alanyl-gamma-D-glutamyl-meso-diaminopimelate ligase